MALTEDLAVFFADFALPATVGGVALATGGILDEDYQEIFRTAGYHPELSCRTEELPGGTAQGDAVVVSGTKHYTVAGMRPDGTGITVLDLVYVSG